MKTIGKVSLLGIVVMALLTLAGCGKQQRKQDRDNRELLMHLELYRLVEPQIADSEVGIMGIQG